LSFSMNTFAENPKVNMYAMDRTEETDDYFVVNFQILCVDGLMFISGDGHGRALVQMMSSSEHPMRCPKYKEE